MKVTIERIKWIEGDGTTKAFLDICLDGSIIIKGWKIIDSNKGRFLAPPSRKGKEEKWWPDVYFRDRDTSDGFRDHVLGMADRDRDSIGNAWAGYQGSLSADQEKQFSMENGMNTDPKDIQGPEDPGSEQIKPNLAKCKSCGASIVWVNTKMGKKMPVDAETLPLGCSMYDKMRMTSHFETCPNADQH